MQEEALTLEDVVLASVHENIENIIDQEFSSDKSSLDNKNTLQPDNITEHFLKDYLKSRSDGVFQTLNSLPFDVQNRLQIHHRPSWWWKSHCLCPYETLSQFGWKASTDIKAGTLLVVSTPLVSCQESNIPSSMTISQMLLYELGQKMNSLLSCNQTMLIELCLSLLQLYPRQYTFKKRKNKNNQDIETITNTLKVCLQSVWDTIKQLTFNHSIPVLWTVEEEIKRLQECIILNCIGNYQNAEQLGFTDRYEIFNFSGLYPLVASRFNHSCRPNVNRVSFGSVTFFRCLRDIKSYENLCVSYLETDALVDPWPVRQLLLQTSWKFVCYCDQCCLDKEKYPNLKINRMVEPFGDELRHYICTLPLVERLETLLEVHTALTQLSQKYIIVFENKLRLLSEIAITQLRLGFWEHALQSFIKCVDLIQTNLGLMDESLICFYFHQARCAAGLYMCEVTNQDKWKQMGQDALIQSIRIHKIIFGGNKSLFISRFSKEMKANFLLLNSKSLCVTLQNKSSKVNHFDGLGLHCAIMAVLIQWIGEEKKLNEPETNALCSNTHNYNNTSKHNMFFSNQYTPKSVYKMLRRHEFRSFFFKDQESICPPRLKRIQFLTLKDCSNTITKHSKLMHKLIPLSQSSISYKLYKKYRKFFSLLRFQKNYNLARK